MVKTIHLAAEVVKRGRFYSIVATEEALVLEDRTKRGLEVREKSIDKKHGVDADWGMIHDMDGIGHLVCIRWYFPKKGYSLDDVDMVASDLEKRYKAVQEVTCPDDDN